MRRARGLPGGWADRGPLYVVMPLRGAGYRIQVTISAAAAVGLPAAPSGEHVLPGVPVMCPLLQRLKPVHGRLHQPWYPFGAAPQGSDLRPQELHLRAQPLRLLFYPPAQLAPFRATRPLTHPGTRPTSARHDIHLGWWVDHQLQACP